MRILLNSKTPQQPEGLANSSGTLGRYLMDHLWVAGGARGDFPDLDATPTLGGPRRPNGIYVIRFRNTANGPRHSKFLRGFGFQGGGSTNFTFGAAGFGNAYKQAARDGMASLNLSGFGECLPQESNFIEIDPEAVDVFGIPAIRISMAWGENEKAMIPDMAETAAEMLDAAGAKNIQPFMVKDRVPGYGIHEMGGARMGADRKTSVLNQFQQAHDVANLFVMDAASFPSGACQNPTLTIMAMAVRSTDYLLNELKRGAIG